MNDPLMNLDLQNERALARAEALSLLEPEDLPSNPFEPPLPDDEDLGEIRARGVG